jgi:hypothetical protein
VFGCGKFFQAYALFVRQAKVTQVRQITLPSEGRPT